MFALSDSNSRILTAYGGIHHHFVAKNANRAATSVFRGVERGPQSVRGVTANVAGSPNHQNGQVSPLNSRS